MITIADLVSTSTSLKNQPMTEEAPQPMAGHSTPADEPMIRALLCEILAKLETLLATGEAARIDLRRLPLPADGLQALRNFLGEGEVNATVRGVGSCLFQETRTFGVWWMTQLNTTGEVVGEFIEIARVPELLNSDPVEMRDAAEDLRRRLAVITE